MTESVRLQNTGVGQVLVSAFLGGVDVPAPRTNGPRHQGYLTLFSLGWHLIQDKVPKTHFVIVLNVNTDIINGMTRTKHDSLLSVTSTGAMTKRKPRKPEQISADQVKGMAPYAWYILTVALKDVNGKALADDSDPDSPRGLRAGIYLINCVVFGLTAALLLIIIVI